MRDGVKCSTRRARTAVTGARLASPLTTTTHARPRAAMVVTQASKTRNDPLGNFSPYGNPKHRAAPGEYSPNPRAPHRTAPHIVLPRSHYIGHHLQIPPKMENPLELRAMRRAVQMEARARKSSRRLEEVEAELAKSNEALIARDHTIAQLKEQLAQAQYALEIANSRIWEPGPRLAFASAPTSSDDAFALDALEEQLMLNPLAADAPELEGGSTFGDSAELAPSAAASPRRAPSSAPPSRREYAVKIGSAESRTAVKVVARVAS